MIRENFWDTMVPMIAHQLYMNDGQIAKFDSPERFLVMEGSMFKAMIDKSWAGKSVL